MTTITNREPNPSFETGLSGWLDTNATSSHADVWAASGSYACGLVSTANPPTLVGTNQAITIPASTYTISYTVFQETGSSRTARVRYNGVNSADTVIPSGTPTRVSATVNGTGASTFLVLCSNSMNVGEALYFDAVLITEGDTLHDYFDGDSDNAEWTGTPHASTSVLTIPDTAPRPSRVFVLGSPHNLGPFRVGGKD